MLELREPSLHAVLKRDTTPAHRGLEAFLARLDLFATLEGYVTFLQGACAFQAEAERILTDCGAGTVIPDWPRRCRARLARQDLEFLGAPPHSAPTSNSMLTKVSQPAAVLGIAYVLEGATLGGAILLKTVAPLDIGPNRGGSFLASYGPDRSVMWKTFLETLARWERLGVEPVEVVSAAAAAFAAARWHFEAACSRRAEQ